MVNVEMINLVSLRLGKDIEGLQDNMSLIE